MIFFFINLDNNSNNKKNTANIIIKFGKNCAFIFEKYFIYSPYLPKKIIMCR